MNSLFSSSGIDLIQSMTYVYITSKRENTFSVYLNNDLCSKDIHFATLDVLAKKKTPFQ